MAMNNDVIDLTGAITVNDNFVNNAYLDAAGELVLEMVDGVIWRVDLTNIPGSAPDNFLTGAYVDGTGTLNLPMIDGNIYTVDLTNIPGTAADKFLFNVAVSPDPANPGLIFIMNDGQVIGPVPLDGVLTITEAGGKEWNAGYAYEYGDVVTENLIAYIAIRSSLNLLPSANPSDWVPVGAVAVERGGVAWNFGKTYVKDDIVSIDAVPYVARLANAGQDPRISPLAWEVFVQTEERGGLEWRAATAYLIGDTVGRNGDIYICLADNTSFPPEVSPVQWRMIQSQLERGGILYFTGSNYVVGDIVVHLDIAYKCIASTTGAFAPAAWESIDERGGTLWNSTTTYYLGDVVTQIGSDKAYVALSTNTNSDPLGLVDWYEFGSIRYNVGLFTPTLAQEYPDVTSPLVTDPGAVWYTSGVDPVNGYVMTTGPLVGMTFMNNDKFVWYGDKNQPETPGDPLDDVWLYEPFPRIKAEIGGVYWSTIRDYTVGDVVTDTGELYMCIVDTPMPASAPSGDPTNWKLLNTSFEVNGIYDPTLPYAAGSIVIGPAPDYDLFVATGAVPIGVTPPIAPWMNATPDEIAGRAWNATSTYRVGDIVTEGDYIYVSLTGLATQPSLFPIDWLKYGSGEGVNVGFDPTITYQGGDLVSVGDELFLAPPGGVPTGTVPPAAPWMSVTPDERGGVAWRVVASYEEGDIVSYLKNSYISLVGNAGVPPDSDPLTWMNQTELATEHGGLLWDATRPYEIGDVVSILTAPTPPATKIETILYTALTLNLNSQPELNPGDWDATVSATERGGVYWNSGYFYNVGDIVIEQNVAWKCIMNHQGEQPSLIGQTVWELLVQAEKGGIAWAASTTYATGDIVTDVGITYFAIVSSIGSIPGSSPTDWQPIERGGIQWIDGVAYKIGDVVTAPDAIYGTSMYRCINPNVSTIGNEPDGSADWDYASKPERGGIAWDVVVTYMVGDIVEYNQNIYIGIAGSVGVAPDSDPLIWIPSGERGGVMFDATTVGGYHAGDIVTDDVTMTMYVCLTDTAAQPSTTPSDWDDIELRYVNATGDTMTGNLNMDSTNTVVAGRKAAANGEMVTPESYATATLGGTLKTRLDVPTSTLYMTNDGTNP